MIVGLSGICGGPAKVAPLTPVKAIVLFPASMVLENLMVQKAHRAETFADRSAREIPDPEMPVIIGSIEVAAMDDHRMVAVLIDAPVVA